jgi:hypothetical protein
MTTYTVLQWIAIAIAMLLWGLSTALLIEHLDPAGSWALYASVPVVTAAIAVLPLFIESGLRAGQVLKSAMMMVLFAVLTAYSLTQLVGRTGEVRDQRVAAASISERPWLMLEDELKRAKARVDDADREVLRECKSGFGSKCDGWKRTLAERQARVAELNRDIFALAPPTVSAPADAKRIAALLHPWGVTASDVNMWQPLLLPVGLEFGVWVLLWFGFSHVSRKPKPQKLDAVEMALARAGRPLTNNELAEALGVTKGAASKMVAARSGRVRKERDGKRVMITLH